MDIPTSGADTWLLLNGVSLSFQRDNENLNARVHETRNNLLRITNAAPDDLEIYVDAKLLETERYGRWYWKAEGYAGLYLLQVKASGYPLQTAIVRVLPEKLTYEHYKAILVDIGEIAIDLLFRLSSPVGEKAIIQYREQEESALRNYKLIQEVLKELEVVIASIRRSPQRVLQEHAEQKLLHEVRQFSSETIPVSGEVLTIPPRVTAICKMRYLPAYWEVQQNTLTYDVHENRLLKQFVQRQLVAKLTTIQDKAQKEMQRREKDRTIKTHKGWKEAADEETAQIERLKQVQVGCQQMTRKCLAWGSESFLKSVKPITMSGKATQVLLKHPSYSRFYRIYLKFQQQLTISLDTDQYLTTLTLRKMWDLYQIWSVFQVTRMIVEILMNVGYQVISNSIFYEVEKDNFQIDVKKNAPTVTLEKDDLSIQMKYEPLYPRPIGNMPGLISTDYEQLTPDMSIEIYSKGEPKHVLVFDAKYRYREISGSNYPLDEDLNKMRKYRDMICYKTYDPRRLGQKPRKIVSSAYILYPGDHLKHDPDEAEVGALRLVPNMSKDDMIELEEAIKDILWFVKLLPTS